MNIKEITFSKSIKIGLPNYSNIDVSFGMTVEAKEGEEINTDECWDYVNKQLFVQTDGIEPGWISTKEFTNFFKSTIKIKK